MARIALAGFIHETNTFAPMPTTFSDFGGRKGILRGDALLAFRGRRINVCSAGFLDAAAEAGHEVVPLVWTDAEPANQVTAEAFERIMGLIAAGLSDQMPLDGLFLELHGAMVTEDFVDGETEIIRRARAIVGDIPIVVTLDLHGNITPRSIELADGMIGYRTYPHIDLYETGQRAAKLMDTLLAGKPYFKAFRQLPFLWPISAQSTFTEPCKSLYAQIDEVEKDPAVYSASIMAGFPPADMPDTGPAVWAYAATQAAADQAVTRLYEAICARESEFEANLLGPDAAVEKAMRLAETAGKPVILADVQDNSGGGATSDTVWILEALVRAGAQDAALGVLFDPQAAAAAHEAGQGATITIDLGGKLMPGQKPMRAAFEVVKLHDGKFPGTGPMLRGQDVDFGKMAQLKIGGVRVVVGSIRHQALDQSYFRVVGIDPPAMKILVLKSANHYRADFEPISSAIIPVEAPGAIVEDPSKAAYVHLRDGVRLKGNGPVHKSRA